MTHFILHLHPEVEDRVRGEVPTFAPKPGNKAEVQRHTCVGRRVNQTQVTFDVVGVIQRHASGFVVDCATFGDGGVDVLSVGGDAKHP